MAKTVTITLRNYWRCRFCGPGVAVDEDGCCAQCGADAKPVYNRRESNHGR